MKQPISDITAQKIVELYPLHTSKEIAVMLNISRTTVNKYARLNNITHDNKLVNHIAEKRFLSLNGKDAIEKKRVALKKTKRRLYMMERFRLMSGDKQATKVRVCLTPRRVRKVISKYISIYNYFQVEGEPYTLYYDKETKRTKTEDFISRKYHLKFFSADE